jgi:DNA-binding transcriptional ArsR family regulator
MLSPIEADAYTVFLKALAHPTRITIVDFLLSGEKPAGDIFNLFDFDISTISKHMSILKNAGILSSHRSGPAVIYNLETSCVAECLSCIINVIKEIKDKRTLERAELFKR